MTSGQLKNKMRRLREEAEEQAEEETGELNLVPYLDIVTNVVIFLLASVTYNLAMSNVNATSPTYGIGSGGEAAEQGPPPLNLTVNVSANGFTIAGSGAVIRNKDTGQVPTVPKETSATDLPWVKLQETIAEIKGQFPDEHNVIIMANPEVTYDKIIKTMDTVRQDAAGKVLFPDVSLSAGVL